MNKNIVYFILYLVVITEMLIVISERDEALGKAEGIAQQISSRTYKQDLNLLIPQEDFSFVIPSAEYHDKKDLVFSSILLIPDGLVSQEEKKNIKYIIKLDDSSSNRPPFWPENNQITSDIYLENQKFSILNNPTTGISEFKFHLTVEDFLVNIKSSEKEKVLKSINSLEYTFSAHFKVQRWIDTTLYDSLAQIEILELLKKDDKSNSVINKIDDSSLNQLYYYEKFKNHDIDSCKAIKFIIRPKLR